MDRLTVILCFLALGTPVHGWLAGGHSILTRAAVRALPEEVPVFFRSGEEVIAHVVVDPDVAKSRATPSLRGAEYPEHFLDREYLDGLELPETRFEYIQLCHQAGVKPEKVGFAPYAVAEWTERLAVAFAEHRKWPENKTIQSKCLVYAGFLSHYAEDLCQPLHLTKHYNGWIAEDGSVMHKGIHFRVDGLPEYFEMDPGELARGLMVNPLEALVPGIMSQFKAGFGLVNRVYEMAEEIPDFEDKDWKRSEAVVSFAEERARASALFTSRLYLTAWRISEHIELSSWLKRSQN